MGLLLAAAFGLTGCQAPSPAPSSPRPASPYSSDEEAAARSALGTAAEILLAGDLAGNGKRQLVVINRVQKPPRDTAPGLLISRLVILQKDGGRWEEILRVDEYLKNAHGYLAGTPLAPVNAWRLQYEQEGGRLALYFTPLETPAGGFRVTVSVRWNPRSGRYQSLDRNLQNFLPESPELPGAGREFRLSR